MLKHRLIIATIISISIAISSGMILKHYGGKSWSERDIMYIKFPGEIFLRIVNCLILPLITSSIVSAICNLTKSGPIGLMALYYYLTTTIIGITLCVILTEIIRPGELMRNENVNNVTIASQNFLTVDTILDLFRNLIPDNIVHACMYQYQTRLEMPDNASAVPIEEWFITSEYMADSNILGLVFYSLLLGVAITSMGTKGKPLSNFFNCLSEAMIKIMEWITLIAPVGVLFLIIGRILEIDDFTSVISHLGFYILTVFIGLLLQGFIILPFLHWIITRQSSYKIIFKLGPAFATAISTSSSTATISYTIRCLESVGINPNIIKFIIPIGAVINMDGIALYETIGAIFIIQLRGLQFSLLKIIIISITCTVSCVGAASIPSGGYMMLIMMLNSIGVPVEDVTLIIAVDWFVDRFRTTINIIGDALGASIISHFYKTDPKKDEYPLEENVIHLREFNNEN